MRLPDDREISQPLERYPTLMRATGKQRKEWELIGPAVGFHWPSLNLDLSVEGLLHGLPERIPAPPPLESLKRHMPSAPSKQRPSSAGNRRVG